MGTKTTIRPFRPRKLQMLRTSMNCDSHMRARHVLTVLWPTAGEGSKRERWSRHLCFSTACQAAPTLGPHRKSESRPTRLYSRRKAGARSRRQGNDYRSLRPLFNPHKPSIARSDIRDRLTSNSRHPLSGTRISAPGGKHRHSSFPASSEAHTTAPLVP